MARDITYTAVGTELQGVHGDGVTPNWSISIEGAQISGRLDKSQAAARNGAAKGPIVFIKNDKGLFRIYTDRVVAAGAFAAWTPGSDLTALNSFINILEALA